MNDFEEMIDEELEEDREEQYFYLVDFLRERVTGKETLSELIDIFESMCQLPIEGIDQEEDCVLFQCGTYRFLGETLFEFSLARQFPDEEDEYYQLRMDVRYQPDDRYQQFQGICEWIEEYDGEISNFTKNSDVYKFMSQEPICRVDIYLDQT